MMEIRNRKIEAQASCSFERCRVSSEVLEGLSLHFNELSSCIRTLSVKSQETYTHNHLS